MAYANASSAHKLGRDAKDALAKARSRIAQSLGMPSVSSENLAKQIVFTSGGTESNNMVLQQSMWRFIITVPTEHHSVFFTAQYMGNNQSCDVVFLSVDGQGRLKDLNELRDLLKG
jgi:cysteine desulfurase